MFRKLIQNPLFWLTFLSGLSLAVAWGLERSGAEPWALYLAAYLLAGYPASREGLSALRHGRLDVEALMLVAALAAGGLGYWLDGGILLFLFALSGLLEEYALDRSRQAVRALMELRPDRATVLRDGQEVEVPVEEVQVGEVVLVRPGERISVDGEVLEGRSAVDESSLTGEGIPVAKGPGDPVFAGTLNRQGALRVRVTKPAEETTLARIVHLVEEAQEEKARVQQLIDRIGPWYSWGVVALALAVGLSPLLGIGTWEAAIYRAVTVLVVASPCAVVLATPATLLAALARGARGGVLIKGGKHLERLATLRAVAFDKTGTLTLGQPRVVEVLPWRPGETAEHVLGLAASVEALSEHPLAEAIVRAARERGMELAEVVEMESVPGQGVRGRVGGEEVWIGTARFLERNGVAVDPRALEVIRRWQGQGRTVVLVGNGDLRGLIAVQDVLRPEAAEALEALRDLGIERRIMVTGDNRRSAAAIARQLGLDEVHAELLPEDKLRILRELEARYGAVGMVGDGVNDAPALARATVGIAMGGRGTDVALETADVVLMGDDLRRLPFALDLSRRARQILRLNLAFALGVIGILLALALTVGLPIPLAVLGHEGSTVVVILSGLRLLRFRDRWAAAEAEGLRVLGPEVPGA